MVILMTSEIMLATTLNAEKLTYPAEVTVKLDGVAADFYKTPNGWVVQSRQGKPILSVPHILRYLNTNFKSVADNFHIIGELTHVEYESFKDAGGIIRRKEENRGIQLNVYDVYRTDYPNDDFQIRKGYIKKFTEPKQGLFISKGSLNFRMIQAVPTLGTVKDGLELSQKLVQVPEMMNESQRTEGLVIRSLRGSDSLYRVNKRSKGMMRYKPKPTLDLQVVSFEEATANKDMTFLDEPFHAGEGLRAVGRINVLYNGEETGVGPGCLTHRERRDLWDRYCLANKRMNGTLIAEVEFMLDASYDGLRQPVFKRWRTDKVEASYER